MFFARPVDMTAEVDMWHAWTLACMCRLHIARSPPALTRIGSRLVRLNGAKVPDESRDHVRHPVTEPTVGLLT